MAENSARKCDTSWDDEESGLLKLFGLEKNMPFPCQGHPIFTIRKQEVCLKNSKDFRILPNQNFNSGAILSQ